MLLCLYHKIFSFPKSSCHVYGNKKIYYLITLFYYCVNSAYYSGINHYKPLNKVFPVFLLRQQNVFMSPLLFSF